MAATTLKNTGILFFFLLFFGIPLTICAADFLFTSINTAQGLSNNQIHYIKRLVKRAEEQRNVSYEIIC